jgi:hypothetical protein
VRRYDPGPAFRSPEKIFAFGLGKALENEVFTRGLPAPGVSAGRNRESKTQ